MEFHGKFSMEFHGVLEPFFHGFPSNEEKKKKCLTISLFHEIPWKSMENIPWNSMENVLLSKGGSPISSLVRSSELSHIDK